MIPALVEALPRKSTAVDATFLVLILIADFALTLLHSYQEWKGAGAPLWRNFGAIVGLKIPDGLGFFGFALVLTLILLAVGYLGIIGPLNAFWTVLALGALIGARLSDTLVSHLALHALGYRPNPGLSSTPLYILEAGFLAWMFHPQLSADACGRNVGLVLGIIFFVSVLPTLKLVWWLCPSCRRPPWQRGQPMPSWATRPSEDEA
jgi:hypothetical protein